MKNPYRQCKIAKGHSSQVSWVPAKFAKVGKVLRLKGKDGTWADGWVVEEVWGAQSEKNLISNEREYLEHRKKSDI